MWVVQRPAELVWFLLGWLCEEYSAKLAASSSRSDQPQTATAAAGRRSRRDDAWPGCSRRRTDVADSPHEAATSSGSMARALDRQAPRFHMGHDHNRELQSLGGVQRGHFDARLIQIELAAVHEVRRQALVAQRRASGSPTFAGRDQHRRRIDRQAQLPGRLVNLVGQSSATGRSLPSAP